MCSQVLTFVSEPLQPQHTSQTHFQMPASIFKPCHSPFHFCSSLGLMMNEQTWLVDHLIDKHLTPDHVCTLTTWWSISTPFEFWWVADLGLPKFGSELIQEPWTDWTEPTVRVQFSSVQAKPKQFSSQFRQKGGVNWTELNWLEPVKLISLPIFFSKFSVQNWP